MITPALCLDSRKLLNWTRYRLGSRCGRSYEFLRAFERGKKNVHPEDQANIRAALEAAGVEFTNGCELGVKLRRRE